MRRDTETVLVTGATGLVGGAVVDRLLRDESRPHIVVLVRDLDRWNAFARQRPVLASRVQAITGDVSRPGCALSEATCLDLSSRVTRIVHAAADVNFTRLLPVARQTNVDGVRNLLALSASWKLQPRFVHVSTAFVAGFRRGRVMEDDGIWPGAWVNAYERTKAEAEDLVRASGRDWLILRLGCVVCDDVGGGITQFNAMHLALRRLHEGVVPVFPGAPDTMIDVIPMSYAADAIAILGADHRQAGRTFHLCAGDRSISLADALSACWSVWVEDREWAARRIRMPRLVSYATYSALSLAIRSIGPESAARNARALSHFVPHLALGQRFDTRGADAALGFTAPAVADYWPAMLERLQRSGWGARSIAA